MPEVPPMPPESVADWAAQNAGRFEFDPKVVHHFSDNLYAKQVHIPAQAKIVSHKHSYHHLSILAKGRVLLRTDLSPKPVLHTAPACIEIRAGLNHEIVALEDSVWFCIHSTDCSDPEKIDEVLIQKQK